MMHYVSKVLLVAGVRSVVSSKSLLWFFSLLCEGNITNKKNVFSASLNKYYVYYDACVVIIFKGLKYS